MMERVFIYLALGILPAFGGPREVPAARGAVHGAALMIAPAVGGIAPITLYTSFQGEPPRAVRAALQDELEQIMAPIGLNFKWRSLSAQRGNEISVELVVVTFQGRCDVRGLNARSVPPGALGWTHVSDGNILPFSGVDCDRIRGFIQASLLTVSRRRREEAFGRALGRVVAHELYHILANTRRHGSAGVAKERYTVQDLMSGDFLFEDPENRALGAGKAHLALANNGGSM
jgi:hypothetical protein